MTECNLYRHFASDGQLLYVGISIDAAKRFKQHQHGSGWAAFTSRIEIERYPSRAEAERAERRAIQTELPIFNKQHNPVLTVLSNCEVGNLVGLTLAEACRIAFLDGAALTTIDPIEFSGMKPDRIRLIRRLLKLTARDGRRFAGLSKETRSKALESWLKIIEEAAR